MRCGRSPGSAGGEGLLCIGYNHVPVQFHATEKEYDAITTSPTDLRSRRKEGVK